MKDPVLGQDPHEIATPTVPRVRGSTERLTLGTLFELLEDKERRFLLYLLQDADRRWHDLDEVIERLGGHCDAGRTEEQLRLSLSHAHLPKLSAAGLVEYDEDGERVRYDGHPLLEEWLQRARREDLD